MRQRGTCRLDHLHSCSGHVARLVEETQLVRRCGPHFGEHGGIERRAISDHLLGLDTGLSQVGEKLVDHGAIHLTMDQLIADQAVAIGGSRIDGEEEGQLILIDLINAEDAREFADHPRLVIALEVERGFVNLAPLPHHGFAGGHPEVAGQPLGDTAHG